MVIVILSTILTAIVGKSRKEAKDEHGCYLRFDEIKGIRIHFFLFLEPDR
jgi:hypothetical protein